MPGSGGTHRQVSPARDLSGVGELVTPRVRQAAEAALGGVQAPTLLTSAVSGTENVGAGASTSTSLTPSIPLMKLLRGGGLTTALLLLALTTTGATPLCNSATSSTTASAASATTSATTTDAPRGGQREPGDYVVESEVERGRVLGTELSRKRSVVASVTSAEVRNE
ncbi:unnamed protein product, partial [Closterium sp. NIES-53]